MASMLDISEVAERTGVAASGLRYYEKRGLISAATRKGLRRQYEPEIIQQIALIRLAQSAGFSLEEVGAVLSSSGPLNIPRPALLERARELEAQSQRLLGLSRMLRHVAKCTAQNHLECKRFRTLMKAALRLR